MNNHQRVENVLTLAALGFLVLGCLTVLAPFVSALLWAVILAFSTWRIYERVLRACGHRQGLAAGLMTLGLALLLLAPVLMVGAQLGENIDNLMGAARRFLARGVPAPPPWLLGLPVIGPRFGILGTAAGQWRGRGRQRKGAGLAGGPGQAHQRLAVTAGAGSRAGTVATHPERVCLVLPLP